VLKRAGRYINVTIVSWTEPYLYCGASFEARVKRFVFKDH
jgi:hypothetical protein